MIRLLLGLLLSITCICSSPLRAQDDKISFNFDSAQTVAGQLLISKFSKRSDEITLGGRMLLRAESKDVSWFVSTAYPRIGKAEFILLGYDRGYNNPHEFIYRVLEILPDGNFKLTPEFGNGQEFREPTLFPRDKNKRANSRFKNGEWLLGFPSGKERDGTVWYAYKDGKITKGGQEVKGPDLLY